MTYVDIHDPYNPAPIDSTLIRVIAPRYLAMGKDGYDSMFGLDNIRAYGKGPLDIDIFKWYLNRTTPVNYTATTEEPRINIIVNQGGSASSADSMSTARGVLLLLAFITGYIFCGTI